jgi:hypothetical protein
MELRGEFGLAVCMQLDSGIERFRGRPTRTESSVVSPGTMPSLAPCPLWCHGPCHVGLDVALGEGTVVDANFVDGALEELTPDAVASDPERTGRGQKRARDGPAPDLGAVHVQPQRGAVVGHGQMAPSVQRKL